MSPDCFDFVASKKEILVGGADNLKKMAIEFDSEIRDSLSLASHSVRALMKRERKMRENLSFFSWRGHEKMSLRANPWLAFGSHFPDGPSWLTAIELRNDFPTFSCRGGP